jgi:AraC family transcriptional regulator
VHPASQHWDALTGDEWLLTFMRAALGAPTSLGPRAPSPRVLLRAKAFLAERFAHGVRLAEVARVVGVSPAYLTTVFTQSEGVSLHQYVLRLRLARALLELPHTNDLAQLALDLGFSHHSHFTHAFRRAIGCTPSHYRQLCRCERQRQVQDAASDQPTGLRLDRLAETGVPAERKSLVLPR